MNQSPIQWVGLDLGPLPNESTWSIIGRFMNNNGVDFTELRKTCLIRTTVHTAPLIRGAPDFFRLTGWEESESERNCFNALATVPLWWFDDRLRFCPLCLEGGYHSFWFQFIPLTCCPVHDIPLRSTCMECNGTTPFFKRTACSLKKAGRCHGCRGWLCGVAYTVPHHLALRCQSELYERRFLPLNTWVHAVRGLSKITRNLVFSSTLVMPDSFSPAIFRTFVNAIFPLPPFCSISRASPVTVLSWSVRDDLPPVKAAPAPSSVGRVGADAATAGPVRTKVMPVYLATVRLLHRWIFGGEPGKNYPDALVDLVRKGRIGVSDYAPEEVAYALFRCTFESDRALTRRKNPYSLEELIESALRPKIHFNVKQHRLEIRIRLLAHYAECYAAVRSKVGVVREFPAFLGTQLYEKHLRPCGFCGMEKGGDFNERQNFLVFGTVPGLPLQPFKRTTCLDSPIVRLLRRYLDDGELRRQ